MQKGPKIPHRARNRQTCGILLLLLLALTSNAAFSGKLYGQSTESYAEVSLGDSVDFRTLDSLGILDPCGVRLINGQLLIAVPTHQLDHLEQAGLTFDVVVEDAAAAYEQRLAVEQRVGLKAVLIAEDVPRNFRLGPVGGSYTIEGLGAILDSMALLFPDLVFDTIIGTSRQGRPIRALRITAPGPREVRPRVLYTGLHHAREPLSMVSLVYTMWGLLEHSPDDATASLLANRELWFVPMLNPDGYAHNLVTNPQGGGLWRRNRPAASDPVDLNRNYGPESVWDQPERRFSTDPTSQNYRGEAPFTEPEIVAIRDLAAALPFSIILNHHSHGNVLIYEERADYPTLYAEDWIERASNALVRHSGYAPGPGPVSIGYAASGTASGWASETSHSDGTQRHAWTPETGTDVDGFWPLRSRYLPLARANDHANRLAARMAGSAIDMQPPYVDMADLILAIENVGTQVAQTVHVRIAGQVAIEQSVLPGEVRHLRIDTGLVAAHLSEARNNVPISIECDGIMVFDSVKLIGLDQHVIFEEKFSNGLDRWFTDLWGVVTAGDAERAADDSPFSASIASTLPNVLELTEPIDLGGFGAADLFIDASVEIVARFHRMTIEVIDESGRAHLLDADGLSVQNHDLPGRRTTLRGLRNRQIYAIPLDSFAGQRIRLRFTIDPTVQRGNPIGSGMLIFGIDVVAARARPTGVDSDDAPNRSDCNEIKNPLVGNSTWLSANLARVGVRGIVSDLRGRIVHTGGIEQSVFHRLAPGWYSLSTENGCHIPLLLVD